MEVNAARRRSIAVRPQWAGDCYSVLVATIGIDIGGTEIKAGLVDGRGTVLMSARAASEPSDLDTLIETAAGLAEEVSGDAKARAIGVGIPGLVSPDSGTVQTAPNMPALSGAPIGALLSSRTGLVTAISNDADMHAWGEWNAGAGAGTSHMICLTVGTGLGSGIVLNGQLYAGATGYGAEAGHIVLDPEGRPCGCGGRGCLETVVSATGIVAMARERIEAGEPSALVVEAGRQPGLTAKTILEAALGGDLLARTVYAEAGRCLGIACASLINLFSPQTIVIGGGVSLAGALLLDPAIAEARTRCYPHLFETCRIVPAMLGTNAGVVGAAIWARDWIG